LNDYGIRHVYETYEGDHINRVAERLEKKVLPFFTANLR
jgi:S-formylglutathione hydrolase